MMPLAPKFGIESSLLFVVCVVQAVGTGGTYELLSLRICSGRLLTDSPRMVSEAVATGTHTKPSTKGRHSATGLALLFGSAMTGRFKPAEARTEANTRRPEEPVST